ncbi:Interleukin-4 receptor subunit alpha [Manis javanica]|nr:Interleukin-4 receptor subunit alpha [Manis javanica]
MVGSDRLAVPPALASGVDPSASGSQQAVQAALQPRTDVAGDSPAQQLLRASAVAAVFERAGWQPGALVRLTAPLAVPAAAPAESRAAPADARLHTLMGDVLKDGPFELQASMLRTRDQAGQRLPHDLLVPALEQGRQSVELRQWLAPVLGERGRWLGALNPQWGYASGVEETADPELVWQEGSVEQRLALLRSERATDAAKARTRLERWKELGAKERLPLVQALAVGLGMDDEPLLEKLLSDRSKEIRENAAQMLSCLPDSAHSQRVMGWMQSMLQQDEKGPVDRGASRRRPQGMGARRHHAQARRLPPWRQEGLAAGADGAAHARVLLDPRPGPDAPGSDGMEPAQRLEVLAAPGLGAALQYQLDVEWIDAAQTMGRDMRHDALLPALMARLSREERESRWVAQFERDRHKLIDAIEGMSQSLGGAELLSPALSARLTEALHVAVGGKQITGNWHSYRADQALLSCARMLDVTALERFAELWRKPSVLDAQPEPEPEPQTEPAAAVTATAAATAAAVAAPASIPLTPQQQARLERSRVRPWDEGACAAIWSASSICAWACTRPLSPCAARPEPRPSCRIPRTEPNPTFTPSRKHTMSQVLRQHAEQQFAEELEALRKVDDRPRPPNWKLSPWAVLQYLMGGKLGNGFEVSPKYIGNPRLMEIAVSTLATDRALLLYGVPGTAKSWVSEHLSAAVSGDSTMLVQGTAGTSEEQLSLRLELRPAAGPRPVREGADPQPLVNAMKLGKIARIEELTRIPADVQDTLITVLVRKDPARARAGQRSAGRAGLPVIATANNRDKGVNELSSALKRRFNTVILPVPASQDEEAREQLQPDCSLVEGPPEGESLLPMLQHADLQPPVAMLVYVQDSPAHAAFYPYAEFSPEWQALQWAARQGVATRFIDLPQPLPHGAGHGRAGAAPGRGGGSRCS